MEGILWWMWLNRCGESKNSKGITSQPELRIEDYRQNIQGFGFIISWLFCTAVTILQPWNHNHMFPFFHLLFLDSGVLSLSCFVAHWYTIFTSSLAVDCFTPLPIVPDCCQRGSSSSCRRLTSQGRKWVEGNRKLLWLLKCLMMSSTAGWRLSVHSIVWGVCRFVSRLHVCVCVL